MKSFKGKSAQTLLYLGGLGLLILGASGSGTCTKDIHSQIVVSVDVTAPFHAQGSTGVYSATKSVDLGADINLPKILSDNSIDSIKEIDVESVFYDVTTPDAEPTRTVTNSTITVQANSGPVSPLFHLDSVLVDDPAIRDPNWGTAPLETAGVGVLNTALNNLLHGTNTQLTFSVGGTSSPTSPATDFWWQARVRLKVIGIKKVTVPSSP